MTLKYKFYIIKTSIYYYNKKFNLFKTVLLLNKFVKRLIYNNIFRKNIRIFIQQIMMYWQPKKFKYNKKSLIYKDLTRNQEEKSSLLKINGSIINKKLKF